jgi:predicted phage terminase large subunit-like protein
VAAKKSTPAQPERIVLGPNPGPQTEAFCSSADITVFGGAAGGGKRLALTEPIPTPSGWTTMGAVKVGDIVFDADGKPTTVTWRSRVEPSPEAWELEFDDGHKIVCDAEHQWVTLTDAERCAHLRLTDDFRAARRAKRPSRAKGTRSAEFTAIIGARNSRLAKPYAEVPPQRGRMRTTAEIVATLHVGKAGRSNHAVLNAAPIDTAVATLPIDPYTLGAWLGDGTTSTGGLTGLDPEVWQSIEAAGFAVTHSKYQPNAHNISKLKPILRSVGLLNNKHVPSLYLRASIVQRTALLQGLCDTDGHATANGGIEFTTTNTRIRDGMMELLASLGIKPSCREGRATLNGRYISQKWRIKFFTHICCFRIPRKLKRQKRSDFRGVHDRRYIVAARKVPPVPMRCIAVSSPSKTYLASRLMVVTHNTFATLYRFGIHAARHKGYFGIIFRRTLPTITMGGGLWEESKSIYAILGARPNMSTHEWRFPNGSLIQFRSMQYEQDAIAYQGAQLAEVCFEEATHFEASQFWYLYSRLRTKCGMKARAFATCNPDPDSWVRHLIDWYIGEDGFVVPGRGGVKRWFMRDGDELIWGDSQEDVRRKAPATLKSQPQSFRFVPSYLSDNPKGDPNYEAKLEALQRVERERLRFGNWNVRPVAGSFFRRVWYEMISAWPGRIIRRVRGWDLASTEPNDENPDPDWTCGVLIALLDDGRYLIEDVVRDRVTPAKVDALLLRTAKHDGIAVTQAFWRDPAQAGVAQQVHIGSILSQFRTEWVTATENKLVYAGPISAASEQGRVLVKRGHWNDAFFFVIEGFPSKKRKKDDVDAMSRAYLALTAGTVDYDSTYDKDIPDMRNA